MNKNMVFDYVETDSTSGLLIDMYLFFSNEEVKTFETRSGIKVKSDCINIYKADIFDELHIDIYEKDSSAGNQYSCEEFANIEHLIIAAREIVRDVCKVTVSYSMPDSKKKDLKKVKEIIEEIVHGKHFSNITAENFNNDAFKDLIMKELNEKVFIHFEGEDYYYLHNELIEDGYEDSEEYGGPYREGHVSDILEKMLISRTKALYPSLSKVING